MGKKNDDDVKFTLQEKFQQKCYKMGSKLGEMLGGKNNNNSNESKPKNPIVRSKSEYVYLGSFPQNIKPRDVSIEYEIGGEQYMGSDGNIYCRKVYVNNEILYDAGLYTFAAGLHNEGSVTRYSDGQDIEKEEYFCVKPIKWYVIDRNEYGVLTLMSSDILFYHCYSAIKGGMSNLLNSKKSWETSDIRKTLNEDFYNYAFTSEEQEKILESCLTNEKPSKGFLSDGTTQSVDKVYIISKKECEEFGLNSVDLSKHQTDFCGQYMDYESGEPRFFYSCWMTRTICKYTSPDSLNKFGYVFPYKVTSFGDLRQGDTTEFLDAFRGVVPVIRVKEANVQVYSKKKSNTANANKENTTVSVNAETVADKVSQTTSTTKDDKANKKKITLGKRIIYTILAPICWFIGLGIAAAITGGGGTGNIAGFIMFAYIVFSEIMVWKLKTNLKLLRALVFLNALVSFTVWMILG